MDGLDHPGGWICSERVRAGAVEDAGGFDLDSPRVIEKRPNRDQREHAVI
jgi:hypothetical protein